MKDDTKITFTKEEFRHLINGMIVAEAHYTDKSSKSDKPGYKKFCDDWAGVYSGLLQKLEKIYDDKFLKPLTRKK